MVECRIPGHITGLYIFAVVNLCVLLNISLVSAEVYVINTRQNVTIATMPDRQAGFGGDFPEDGLIGRLVYVKPHNACDTVEPPPKDANTAWIALIARGSCHFDEKVFNVQNKGFIAAIVHNFEGDDSLVFMSGDSEIADKVHIPSVFVGYTDGISLALNYSYVYSNITVKIQEPLENDFNYFWPFTIVVSVCFLILIVFSIFKCIRYFQYRRRTLLSRAALRRIPVRKYKKGDHYDTCAICLEDYEEGEKLRVLPCDHTYHCKCIDPWLTKRKKTCPQCKRRVIPGQESDSDSETEGEGEGVTENTPLLRNGSAGHSGAAHLSRGRTSAFDRADAQAEVVTSEEELDVGHEAAAGGDGEEEVSDKDPEGAVGGVGIVDQDDKGDVVVEVESVHQDHSSADDITALICDESHCPATVEGSINAALTSSVSSEDDGNGSAGRKGKKKKRRSNQVV